MIDVFVIIVTLVAMGLITRDATGFWRKG